MYHKIPLLWLKNKPPKKHLVFRKLILSSSNELIVKIFLEKKHFFHNWILQQMF